MDSLNDATMVVLGMLTRNIALFLVDFLFNSSFLLFFIVIIIFFLMVSLPILIFWPKS